MKKQGKIILTSIVILLTTIFIFNACNKEEIVNNKEIDNILDSKSCNYYYSKYNEINDSRIIVEKISDTRTKIIVNQIANDPKIVYNTIIIPEMNYYMDSVTKFETIEVPTDGKKYWIIPFDPQQSIKRASGGDSFSVHCDCTEGAGGCQVHAESDGTQTVFTCIGTETKPCTGCCQMTVVHKHISFRSILVLEADTLQYNGNLYY